MVRKFVSRVAVMVLVAAALVVLPERGAMALGRVIPTRAAEVVARVDGVGGAVVALPFAAQHVALHWPGNGGANVTVALSSDGVHFGPSVGVQADEVGAGHPNGEFYGAVIWAGGATHARVVSDRALARVVVLALADGLPEPALRQGGEAIAGADVGPPGIITRAGWGADESLRVTRVKGKQTETWPPDFSRVQKLIVHHTVTATDYTEEGAAAEIRAIYYYHAVTQGWGDIGYNFIVDRFGKVYEGRYSGSPTGEDDGGRVVTAGHTYQHNVGTVGVALLDDLTSRQPTAPARSSVVSLLAWEAARHQLDPTRISTYRNTVNGLERTIENLAGHRDYNATACPGDQFYPELGGLRTDVRTASGVGDGDVTPPGPASGLNATVIRRRQVTLTWTPSPEQWPAGSGIAFYAVERAASPGGPYSALGYVDERTLTYTDTSARSGSWYRIVAVDGAGNLTPSLSLSVQL